MIDFIEEFKEYLPQWCDKNMMPKPKEGTDKWNMAWYDFMNDVLTPRFNDIAQHYKNMKFKTKHEQQLYDSMSINTKDNSTIQDNGATQEQQGELSDWEKVQQLLKKKQ